MKYTSLEQTIRNMQGLNEDENTTSPQPYPFAAQDAKPQAPKQSAKKKDADPKTPWSDKDDPNTIKIGETTPVDLEPQLDIRNPKADKSPVGQNATIESVVNENEYNLSRKKSTLEADLAFAKYHRGIGERVMEIVKRRQKEADTHGIRPFGHMASLTTESSGMVVRHPVEVLGHVVDSAMKGLGSDARLNIHVPREGSLGAVQSRLGSETNKNAKKGEKLDGAKVEAKPEVKKEPAKEKSVNDRMMDAIGKMDEGFVKRRYNMSDVHAEVDKFHPSVPHEAVEHHVNGMTSHWSDPVQKSQAANDAISYHAKRKRDFNHQQGSGKLSLSSPQHDNGSGISENVGGPDGSIGGATGNASSGVSSMDKNNVKQDKIRRAVTNKNQNKQSFSNKNWNSPGVSEDAIDWDVKWSDLKNLHEIMGYRNFEDRERAQFPKTKEDYLRHAVTAEKSAKTAEGQGKHWHAKMFRRIRDRHLVHYIDKADHSDLKKLHKAMTSEQFEHMMKDKYSTIKE